MDTDCIFNEKSGSGVRMYVDVRLKRFWAPANILFFGEGCGRKNKKIKVNRRFLGLQCTLTYTRTPERVKMCNMGCFLVYVCTLCTYIWSSIAIFFIQGFNRQFLLFQVYIENANVHRHTPRRLKVSELEGLKGG